MPHSTKSTFSRRSILLSVFLLASLTGYCRADDVADAKNVAASYLTVTDSENAEGAYKLIGEQWTRTAPKSEIIAGLRRWFDAKGGSAPHELVAQKTMTEQEARALAPGSTGTGNVYVFRYRSKYPKAIFFEDVYVGRDSDGVLRIEGHHPVPA